MKNESFININMSTYSFIQYNNKKNKFAKFN